MKTELFRYIILFIFSLVSIEIAGAQTFNWLWAKTIRGISSSSVTSMAVDDSGNVYAVGWFYGYIDINPGPGAYHLIATGSKANLFILKLTSYGEYIWAKSIVGNCNIYANSIALDANGSVYITGNFNSGGADFDPGPGTKNLYSGSLDAMFITKLDSAGNFKWANGFSSFNSKSLGNSIAIDSAFKNIYVTGQFRGTVDFNPGAPVYNLVSHGSNAPDIFVSKFDSLGNFIWAIGMGGSAGDAGASIMCSEQNIYVTGNFGGYADFDPGTGTFYISATGYRDIFVSKLSQTGNFVWAVKMGSPGSDYGTAIALDDSENVYTTGYFELTADFYPGTGGYYLNSSGQDDIFISKLDSSGDFIWAKGIGGASNDRAFAISLDRKGNGDVWTTGQFYNTVDFDPGPGLFNLNTNGNTDIFTSRLNSSGDFVWANSKGGNESDIGTSIIMGDSSNAFIAGSFYSPTIWFNNLIDTNTNFSGYTCDNFIGKLSCRAAVTHNVLACLSYISPSGNYTWTTSGSYTDTLYTISGCDSVILINLIVGSGTTYSTLNLNACDSMVSPSLLYIWKTTGIYMDTIPNTTGCDSVMLINLFVGTQSSSSITDTSCDNYISPSGNYTWTNTGIYSDTLTSYIGCDSIITVYLTLNKSYSTISDTGCNNYMSPSGVYNWTTSGNFHDTIPNASGCDSMITINLILKKSYSTQSVLSCNPYLSPSGNYIWTNSGTYKDTIVNSSGCDSIITINLSMFVINTSVTQIGNTLNANSNLGFYQWLDCDNGFLPVAGATNKYFTPSIDGHYAIAILHNGCTDTSACYAVIGVGINEINSQSHFELFPNPATNQFTIALKDYHKPVEITIRDIAGKEIYAITVRGKRSLVINTKYFEEGIYTVGLKRDDFTETQKLIITK